MLRHLVKAAVWRLGFHRHRWRFTGEETHEIRIPSWPQQPTHLQSGTYRWHGNQLIARRMVASAYCLKCGAPHLDVRNPVAPVAGKDEIPFGRRVRYVIGWWGRNSAH